jgi:hypothetical protein
VQDMNGTSKEATASRCQTCPTHVAMIGKGQKTCRTPDIRSICWPELAIPGQAIEASEAEHLSD